jgi:threonine/homoserine/homoserine lactone efflux protein
MIAFLLPIWALLLAPGPSNSLMALSGLQVGFTRSIRLLPAEVSAYLLTVVPLSLIGKAAVTAWPSGLVVLKLIAAVWVLRLAVGHWLGMGRAIIAQVSFREMFVTTLLNPKALIFGCVLLPQAEDIGLLNAIALFAASVVAVALIWVVGASLAGSKAANEATPRSKYLPRLIAAWLALLSLGLAGSAFQ